MKISKQLAEMVNEQINRELESAYLYMSMGAYLEGKSLNGMARWMYCQFNEETYHAKKFIHFLSARGGRVTLTDIKQLETNFKSPRACFEQGLKHEMLITEYLKKLLAEFREAKDMVSEDLLLWYLDEQIEEEAKFADILDKFSIIGNEGTGLLALDKELGDREECHCK